MLHGFFFVADASSGCDNGLLHINGCIYLIFNFPEAFHSILGNQLMQKLSVLILNQKVGIQKPESQPFGSHDTHGAFSGARHSDQNNILSSVHFL